MSTRRRAAIACTNCHRHKVRCDASSLGHPCTRCKSDDHTCVLRKQGIRRPSPVMTDIPGYRIIDGASLNPQTEPDMETTQQMDWAPVTQKAFVHYSQYSFVETGDTSAFDDADIAFLTVKGCLQIPSDDLLQDFIKQFFIHIQPCSPLIDESLFWNIYDRKSDHGQSQSQHISLLLFQAMLFASSPYVSSRTIEKCGFKDKRTAWTTLYQRAKLLYNSPIKVDPITRAQTALLLTFYTPPDEPQSANLWLTHAIQSANQAHPKPHERALDAFPTLEASSYDRLWWSILLRDRILCLGLRRQPQVLRAEMEMINGLPEATDFEAEINGSRVYESRTRQVLFIVFRDLCELAVLLTEMVSMIYGQHGLLLPAFTTEDFHARLALANSMQTSLSLWKKTSEISSINCEKSHSSVLKFIYLAMMYHHAARVNLAHYQALLIEKHRELLGDNYAWHIMRAGGILLDAATHMVSVMKYFSRNGRSQDAPLSIMGYLAMPLILSAINFKLSPTAQVMQDRRRILEYLGEILKQSRRVYPVTDFISSEFDKILQLAYYISSTVFRQGSSPSTLPKIQTSQSDGRVTSGFSTGQNSAMIKNTNWLDAFYRHTRVYLFISTTVDYYMSVGRMPQLTAPPECMLYMPQFNVKQLPWRAPSKVQKVTKSSQKSKSYKSYASRNAIQQLIAEASGRGQDKHGLGSILEHAVGSSSAKPGSTNDTEENEKGHEHGKRLDLDFMSFEDATPAATVPIINLDDTPQFPGLESNIGDGDGNEGQNQDHVSWT